MSSIILEIKNSDGIEFFENSGVKIINKDDVVTLIDINIIDNEYIALLNYNRYAIFKGDYLEVDDLIKSSIGVLNPISICEKGSTTMVTHYPSILCGIKDRLLGAFATTDSPYEIESINMSTLIKDHPILKILGIISFKVIL